MYNTWNQKGRMDKYIAGKVGIKVYDELKQGFLIMLCQRCYRMLASYCKLLTSTVREMVAD
jgi:hypothetical protein